MKDFSEKRQDGTESNGRGHKRPDMACPVGGKECAVHCRDGCMIKRRCALWGGTLAAAQRSWRLTIRLQQESYVQMHDTGNSPGGSWMW